MVMIRTGDRIGRHANVRVTCDAAIFDNEQKILLTKRRDNGLWTVPGGSLNAGESVTEACEREVLEETGLIVRATRLIAVYSSPHRVCVYPDNTWQHVEMFFAAEILGGSLRATEETSELKFITLEEAAQMPLLGHNPERLSDAFASRAEPFIK